MAEFQTLDRVQSTADASQIGTIVRVGPEHAGMQYYIADYGGGQRVTVSETNLRPYTDSHDPCENLRAGLLGGYQGFQRLVTHLRLLREHPLRNNIYAFNASRTRFFPYQFKPLLKLLDSTRHRLLIADEVGLGKTIEAGLILTELMARQHLQRVLVVCPSNLTSKWRLELRNRFGEDFEIVKSSRFLDFLEDYEDRPERANIKGIISLESIRRNSVLDRLDALAPDFDLVIVDEAHHMRNFSTKQRQAGVLLGQGAGTMLMLTATPIHLGNENLFSLLNILDEEDFPDMYTVDKRFQNNEPIVHAQICVGQVPPNVEKALELLEGIRYAPEITKNPLYSEVVANLKDLKSGDCTESEKMRIQLEIQRDLSELNLIGHIFTRTRKREVQEHVAERQAFPLRLEFTEAEQQFYLAVTAYVREESKRRTDSPIIRQWILNTPQRRVASSIPAMVRHYQNHLGLDREDLSEDLDTSSMEGVSSHAGELEVARRHLQQIVADWPVDGPDSKYEKFIEILRQLKSKEGNIKVVVFAFFKATLNYLLERLRKDGIYAVLISGDVDADERPDIIERFRTDPEVEVLLSSRVGSEGLDFQFSNILFNYDLPWNPMEVEQRIGRLDRIGQESSIIRIYNFSIEGTIEQRILERLYERLDIFRRSIGELEAILGDKLQDLERDLLVQDLSPEEEERRIVETALVIEQRLNDLEQLENETAQFLGVDQYFEEEVRKIRDCRRYITGEQLRRFYVDFIRHTCPRTKLEYDLYTNRGKLYPDEKLRTFITHQQVSGDIIEYLNPSGRGISITFDSQTAFNHPNLDFINILHPLTQAISRYYGQNPDQLSNAHHVVLNTQSLQPGFYFYSIFLVRTLGARSANTLEMVILNDQIEEACSQMDAEVVLGEMVEKGEDPVGAGLEIDPQWIQEVYDYADTIFLDRVGAIRNALERSNDSFVDRRLVSLRSFYNKRIDKQCDLLLRGESSQRQERYLRMLRGTLTRLESELKNKEDELEQKRNVGVHHEGIAAGILEVSER